MKCWFLLFLTLAFTVDVAYSQRHVKVRGYYRKDGTYVRPHYRTAPNSTNRDNFSTRGNTNPYTGKRGWVRPDSEPFVNSSARTNTTVRRQITSTRASARHHERKKVGRYPNGYVYATTKSSGQLWRTSHQLDRVGAISRGAFVRVLGYENDFWKVVCDGATGYVHQSAIVLNDDMVSFKTSAQRRSRSIKRPVYTTSTTRSVSNPVTVQYAPLSSAQSGNCTANDRKRLIDVRYIVTEAYLMNRPTDQGQPMLRMSFGDKVNIICTKGRWHEVVYQSTTGWVEGRLVRE